MVALDPTQSTPTAAVVAELAASGFADATEIGRGGSGVVYRCLQAGLGRVVVVKVLDAVAEAGRVRFAREQQAMARLTGHPNIVAVLQVGQTPSGRPFLVMPLCGQGSLQERIVARGVLDADEALEIGAKVAGALAAAHRVGVVHRDVTPANIVFTDYGEPALTDFGLARISGGFETAEQVFAGTPAFTAPELLAGAPQGEASDVYGLGATLFAALTGHAAFERRHGEQVVAQFIRIAGALMPEARSREIPAEVAAIIAAAMAPDPADRPSAQALSERLRHVRLRGDAPVPATGSGPTAGNLPAPAGQVVGREAEVARLRQLVSESRLVTLTGVGGVGKTTLALHAATGLRGGFRDGVWLIELAELKDGTLLSEVVAGVLGVRDQSGRPLSEALLSVLCERQTLLVLDNCEHLVDDAAKFVDLLLRHCPRVHVLATSRGILDLAGENAVAVPPLAVPDSANPTGSDELADYSGVALFVQRARAAVPDFALTDRNATAVARICARLEGLPLAIELAAARLRAMSTDQIADGLADRYALLTRGHRGAASRHRTLAGCIEWSYQLCTHTERQLWQAFSVFAGSFDLPGAQHLADDLTGADVLVDVLGALVDKSILLRVQQGDEVRFRLLETLRDYGMNQLPSSQRDRLRARHADWYHRLVAEARPQWFGHGQLYWSERFKRELPNIREALQYNLIHNADAALEMAEAMRSVWLNSGMLAEARRWLGSALDAAPHEPTPLRIRALGHLSFVAFAQGDLPAACALVDEARGLLAEKFDAERSAEIDCMEGYLAVQQGDLERAETCIRRAVAVVVEPEVRWGALYYLGWLLAAAGELDEAVRCFEEAMNFSKSHGESIYQSRALVSVGMGHSLRGDAESAVPALIEGLRLSQFVGDPFNGAQCLETLAWLAASQSDWHNAALMMAAADAQSRAIGVALLYVPALIACHDWWHSQIREHLGVANFGAVWADGAALTFDDAVALAVAVYDN